MNDRLIETEYLRGTYGAPAGLGVYNSIEGWHLGHMITKAEDGTYTVLRFVGQDYATVYTHWRVECEGIATEQEAVNYAIVNGRMISRADVARGM